MGKGDKKTKKGKIWKGSYGNSRKRKVKTSYVASDATEKTEKAATEAKPKAKKAPKKAPAKKKAKAADKE